MIFKYIGLVFAKWHKFRNYCISRYNTSVFFKGKNKGKGYIGAEVSFINPQNISIGKNTYINGGKLFAKGGRIEIGQNCLISYGVHIRTDMHNYKKMIPIIEQGHSCSDIIIGDDCWIGYGVQIMSGVNIAKGCVIGAGAIVTKDTEEYGVYVGVPAYKIGGRDRI